MEGTYLYMNIKRKTCNFYQVIKRFAGGIRPKMLFSKDKKKQYHGGWRQNDTNRAYDVVDTENGIIIRTEVEREWIKQNA